MTNFVLISKSNKKGEQSYAANSIKNKISIGNTTFYHSDPYYSWKNSKNDQFYILGNIIGIRKNNKIENIAQDKSNLKILENFNLISEVEGRFVIIKISETGLSEVWSDNFGTREVYKQTFDGNVILSSNLSLLPIAKSGGEFNQLGFAHTLTVYGSRPAKKHTLYKDVSRLGVNEGFKIINGNLEIIKRDFIAKSTEPKYFEDKLEEYTDLFLEAVRARASENGNIVYLSSGWDSTSILAALVHLFGKDKLDVLLEE